MKRQQQKGPGYAAHRAEKGYDKRYFKSLTSEKRVIQNNGKIIWKKIRKNNEALDCRNYAMAAFDILKPQLEKLAQLEGARGVSTRNTMPTFTKTYSSETSPFGLDLSFKNLIKLYK